MKAYIIYIATLLAALALPASGQTGSTDTKAAPDKPAMPYKLSLISQYYKSMRKAFWNIEHLLIFSSQLNTKPLSVCL